MDNPDATFQNNLDFIRPGLTKTFEQEYALSIQYAPVTFNIPNYHFSNAGRYHKYNYEINQIYYCCNNTILHGDQLIKPDPSKYLLFDYCILDLQNKRFVLYDNNIKDSFINIPEIKNISIQARKSGRNIYLYLANSTVPMLIKLDKENKMREFIANMLPKLDDEFCIYNNYLEVFESYMVKEIGNHCFSNNIPMSIFRCPFVKKIGNYFGYSNKGLKELHLDFLKSVGDDFLRANCILEIFEVESLRQVGNRFLFSNTS